MKIAVLGGGNGSLRRRPTLSTARHEVGFWRRNASAFRPVLEAGTVRTRDFAGTREVAIARPTTTAAGLVMPPAADALSKARRIE